MQLTPFRSAVLAAALLALPAQAQSLSTLFTSNNGGSAGWVVMFDATILNPAGLKLTALDVNCSSGAALAITVDLWLTPNTYVGVERNPAAWTKVSTGAATSAARNTPTFVDMADFVLAPGTYGLGVQVLGGSGQAYTNGTGGNQSYADTNLSLQLGAALASQFLQTGLLFTPRVWNGTIYYASHGFTSYGVYGSGCAGTSGTPALAPAAGSLPAIGQTLTLNLSGGPAFATAVVMMLGFRKDMYFGVPLPLDLSSAGLTGCNLLVAPSIFDTTAMIGGVGTYLQPIPNSAALFGMSIHHQGLVLDPAANPAGVTVTNGGEGSIGQ